MNILKVKTEKRKLGNFGERAACRYLFFHGYRILFTNYVSSVGEIDIIATRAGVISFIEVKTRTVSDDGTANPRPAASVTAEKQRKIIRSSIEFMEENCVKEKRRSFDVIEVYADHGRLLPRVKQIKHIMSAFDKSAFKKR